MSTEATLNEFLTAPQVARYVSVLSVCVREGVCVFVCVDNSFKQNDF